MIVYLFIVVIGAAIALGAWLSVRVQRQYVRSDDRFLRSVREQAICDEAEDGWTR